MARQGQSGGPQKPAFRALEPTGAIGDRQASVPFLLIQRDTIQFNTSSNYELDLATFAQLVGDARNTPDGDLPCLEKAASLYRGRFLEGFVVRNSPPFEEWVLFKQEQINRLVLSTLCRLAACYQDRGEYAKAQACARQQIDLEPWREIAHRQLMHALALGGQRNAAMLQYEACCRTLKEGLGVKAARETTALYKHIRDGALSKEIARSQEHPIGIKLPRPPRGSFPPTPLVVGRERELAKLDRFLELALEKQGRVAFVVGDAGSGKTTLVNAFCRQAMAMHDDLIVVCGRCNTRSGIGDLCLPFREILRALTGDIEAQRACGVLTNEHAHRLSAVVPDVIRALTRSRAIHSQQTPVPVQQPALFEQVTDALRMLSRQHALILVLDDLQWADAGSISLLFHLGRRLTDCPILIVGAYRPAEIELGRPLLGPAPVLATDSTEAVSGWTADVATRFFRLDAGQMGWDCHPLKPVVNEFQSCFGDIQIDLDQTDGQAFVDALLDSAPNRLDAAFRRALARHTEGHALFTVELLAYMKEHGHLVQGEAGRWVTGEDVDWEWLPARVEAIIAERLSRLPDQRRAMSVLAAASVEGEIFTAEVIAHIVGVDEGEMVRYLSGPLSRQHGLVSASSFGRLNGCRLSCYRFRNHMFRTYLYAQLDEVERAYLHEAIGNELELLYKKSVADHVSPPIVAEQLVYHFERAGMTTKAMGYLHRLPSR